MIKCLVNTLNTKEIYSYFSDERVSFVDKIEEFMLEDKENVYLDGFELWDRIEECKGDVGYMYCYLKEDSGIINLFEFYRDYGTIIGKSILLKNKELVVYEI